jgi:hypothetical protein
MKIKIFCRCSLFPSWSGWGLINIPVYLSPYIRSWHGQVKFHCVIGKDEMVYRPMFCSRWPRIYAPETNTLCVPHYVLSGYVCLLYCKVHFVTILGAFAKLRKATISCFMSACQSVRPSVRIEQRGSHWTDFYEITYLIIFRKPVGNLKVSLKSDGNNGYFIWRQIYIFDYIFLSSS